ncbi:MAG: radical SAM protein [Candidatus Iainarchaeum archaeon]|uniref:Radical SAM protein n=1 Tax=Candidatus Iainarchaeum sp. TaxID=3101447 RepID=A0A7T9DIZ9_9ARCH|nr:MAG: radical SAM protein [Candidatus Diapherotrites archaeon]
MPINVLMLNPPYFPHFSKNSRSPAVSKGGCVYYPIWLGYATGALELDGHHVKLVDATATPITMDQVKHLAKEFNPKMIMMHTVTSSVVNDAKVAHQLKEILPHATIVMVGPHVSAVPHNTLEIAPAVDIIARKEYDLTAMDIAKWIEHGKDVEKLKDIKGISYRDPKSKVALHTPDREDVPADFLDKLPFASEVWAKHLKIEDYFYPSVLYPEVTIITGRGCPFRCTFCDWPQNFTGHNFRSRSVKNIVDEFEWIKNNLPQVKDIMIEDDTFTLDKKRVREIAEEVIRRNLKVTWTVNARCDVDFETLQWMKKAGCRLVCVGVESSTQEILNNIKKGTNVQKIEQFFDDTKKAGVLVHACFMMGNRGETKETIAKTVEFAKKVNPDTVQFFPIMVYPGTEAFEWAKTNGFLTTQKWDEWLLEDGTHNTIVSTDKLSAKELVDACDDARRSFYMRPRFIAEKIWEGITTPSEFPRLLKSGKTFFKYLFNTKEKVSLGSLREDGNAPVSA